MMTYHEICFHDEQFFKNFPKLAKDNYIILIYYMLQ